MLSPSPIPPPESTIEHVRHKAAATAVRIVTILLIIAVPLMIGAICWRWATIHEPTAAVVIGGDPSLEGTVIEVRGARHSWTVGLDSGNGWQTPVLLDPGTYHITATHHGRPILDETFHLDRLKGIRFDLPSMVQISGSNVLSDAKIEVIHETTHPEEIAHRELKLSGAEHYRAPIYLFPGTYRAVAKAAGPSDRVLTQVEFTVDRTKPPLRIDLARAMSEGE